jgi:hypothetical protein
MSKTIDHWLDGALVHPRASAAARGALPALLVVANVASLAALALIAMRYYVAGLTIFLLGRLTSALAPASSGPSPRYNLDRLVYAGVPFAFALADPGRALAAGFLLFAFAASSSSAGGIRSADGAVCLAAYALACSFPEKFSLIAYALGIACFAAAGWRLTSSRP